ncbi:maleylpyruvate isomerase family mycothiol-dependent enzyme [Kribbella antibiotica]|uniref:Maleylpyruvate isomerase family mycothiol-dependent enzyme n=1 Tax=Kribbella antibiotica TaxID=190195 RepID=A0A4V6PEB4_9ACTN|nr:maleylpyruvate isomerase family mycothiol-dependent enzyme [Kribbella antibiotica]TDD63407.1 maleylpyruvate isomerase family mycothiol-dependent enzyme [Kribbella antibiotica]
MSNADIVIAAIRSGYDRLADVVKKLDDDALAGPSAATEWDIAQVLSHLGSGAEISTNTLQLAIDGQPPAEGDFNQTVWARWDSSSRREQADGFLEWNDKLIALFESLDADQRENLRVELSWLPAPIDVAGFGRMRLSELTHHSWDVRSATDPDATLDAAAVPEMLQNSGNLSWISKPAALNGETAVLAVTTTDPETTFTLRLADPVTIDEAPADQPGGTLTLPAEAWLRLAAGRLGPDRTPASVELTGPITLDTLRGVFAGF